MIFWTVLFLFFAIVGVALSLVAGLLHVFSYIYETTGMIVLPTIIFFGIVIAGVAALVHHVLSNE